MYKVIREKSTYYGFIGDIAHEGDSSVVLNFTKDQYGNNYQGMAHFLKKDIEKITQ